MRATSPDKFSAGLCKYYDHMLFPVLHITEVLELDFRPLVIIYFYILWCSKAILLSSCVASNIHSGGLILLELFWLCVQLLFTVGPCKRFRPSWILLTEEHAICSMYVDPVWGLCFFKFRQNIILNANICVKSYLFLIIYFSSSTTHQVVCINNINFQRKSVVVSIF